MKTVWLLGTARTAVLAKYQRDVDAARELLAVAEAKRMIAAEGALADCRVRGRIAHIDDVNGTLTTVEG